MCLALHRSEKKTVRLIGSAMIQIAAAKDGSTVFWTCGRDGEPLAHRWFQSDKPWQVGHAKGQETAANTPGCVMNSERLHCFLDVEDLGSQSRAYLILRFSLTLMMTLELLVNCMHRLCFLLNVFLRLPYL